MSEEKPIQEDEACGLLLKAVILNVINRIENPTLIGIKKEKDHLAWLEGVIKWAKEDDRIISQWCEISGTVEVAVRRKIVLLASERIKRIKK